MNLNKNSTRSFCMRNFFVLFLIILSTLFMSGCKTNYPKNLAPVTNKEASPATTKSAETTASAPSSAELIKYVNSDFGFTLKLPKTWENYQVKTQTEDFEGKPINYLHFELPVKNPSVNFKYCNIWAISIYPETIYEKIKTEIPYSGNFLTQNQGLIFDWKQGNKNCDLVDLDFNQVLNDVKTIVQTFNLID